MAAIKDDNNRVREWENGLPSTSDLTPLSHSLITGVLARAFCIPPSSAPAPTAEEVMRASQSTLQLLQQQKKPPAFSLPLFDPYSSYEAGGGRGPFGLDEGMDEDRHGHDSLKRGSEDTPPRGVRGAVKGPPMFGSKEGWGDGENGPERDGGASSSRIGVFGNGNPTPEMGHGYFWPPQGVVPAGQGLFAPLGSDYARYGGLVEAGSESTKGASLDKSRKVGDTESEDVDSADGPDGNTARTLKRPRLVWTPQLHKRFVDAVGHLGIKNAVPKTIMQLMNVEGLTRENVASHLQKYRLYLKRMHGLSTEGPSASDPLFASTPLPPGLGASHFFSSHQHTRPESGVSGTPFSSPPVPVPRAQGSLPPPGGMEAAAAAAAAAVRAAPAMGLGPVHFRGFENHPYNIALPRTASSQRPGGLGEHRDLLVNNSNNNTNHSSQPGGAGSPPHRVLPLFPPSGR